MSHRVLLKTHCGCKREMVVPQNHNDTIRVPYLRASPLAYGQYGGRCPSRNVHVGYLTFEYQRTLEDGVELFMEVE